MRLHGVVIAFVIGALAPSVARAQAREHDGFYLRLGAGLGYSIGKAKPDRGAGDATASGAAAATEVAVGGTVAPGLVIGGGSYSLILPSPKYDVDGTKADGGTHHVGGLGPFVDYYVNPKEGLHAQAALLLAYMVVDKTDHSEGASGPGFGGMLGVGYEVWLGEQWSLGPLFRVTYHSATAEQTNSDIKTKISLFTPTLLLGVTYH